MITIKLMSDYGCHPLWACAGEVGEIDPDALPLSDTLKARLQAWAAWYDATLNWDDPAASGFACPRDEQAFNEEGTKLAESLRRELGPGFTVITMI